MNLNSLIVKNFAKNLKNYGLYLFSLIFSVALYFSLVLLSKDPSANKEISESTSLDAMFTVGSVLTLIIIATFICFANLIFIKRRHKELALFQLVGMNKNKVFRILALENAMMYFGSLVVGIAVGTLFSRLFMMILLKIMKIDMAVDLYFSSAAVMQTVLVFIVIFIILMFQNYVFLRGKKLIDLFKLSRTSEQQVKKLGVGTIIFGIIGILMIAGGYYLSTELFDFSMDSPILLFVLMPVILFLTIIGTYITFKASVAFVLNLIRKRKNGHVNVNDVLSITSIMFKMKSNSLLLTVITTLTALSISAMSLSYIMYYSADELTENSAPYDYTFQDDEEAYQFYTDLLEDNDVEITPQIKHFVHYDLKESDGVTVKSNNDDSEIAVGIVAISDKDIANVDVSENEVYVTGVSSISDMMMEFNEGKGLTFAGEDYEHTLEITDIEEETVLPPQSTFSLPTAIVDDEVYQKLEEHQPELQSYTPTELYGFDIKGGDSEEIYDLMNHDDNPEFTSKLAMYTGNLQNIGLTMFIIAFVGFSFLLTSGCILYFKQIGECEDEKDSYKVLRKLGFSQGEIIRGLSIKMLITFGIPLIIGLGHTYFAVNAGWFIFGTEMWTPMITVMVVYTVLYSMFALLSLGYYKKVVKQSL